MLQGQTIVRSAATQQLPARSGLMKVPARRESPVPKRLAIALLLLLLIALLFVTYTSSLVGVREETVDVYRALKEALVEQGYAPRLLVMSGRRYALDNKILATLGGASRNSRHLQGDAIDVVVLDVNRDGKTDRQDVDIVYQLLDRKLVGDRGGIGTYKGEWDFFSRQMVHFDLRGNRARWHR